MTQYEIETNVTLTNTVGEGRKTSNTATSRQTVSSLLEFVTNPFEAFFGAAINHVGEDDPDHIYVTIQVHKVK